MNYPLKNLPERTAKPRISGFTMAMDKGMSVREAEDFVSVAGEYLDVVKLGWATSAVTPHLREKIAVYHSVGIPVYFGGTLFEIFLVRNQLDDYKRLLETYGLSHVEVSNGSMDISDEDKAKYIRSFAANFTVFAEVGSKDSSRVIPPYKWVEMMQHDLDAGAFKVIAEARESGSVGVFQSSGEVRSGLVDEILHTIPQEKVLWEAPRKEQQIWFIKLLGANVNLGNIAPNEMIGLETLRLGLRGDTFHTFLNG